MSRPFDHTHVRMHIRLSPGLSSIPCCPNGARLTTLWTSPSSYTQRSMLEVAQAVIHPDLALQTLQTTTTTSGNTTTRPARTVMQQSSSDNLRMWRCLHVRLAFSELPFAESRDSSKAPTFQIVSACASVSFCVCNCFSPSLKRTNAHLGILQIDSVRDRKTDLSTSDGHLMTFLNLHPNAQL